MKIGYARVSTREDKYLQLQIDELLECGCKRIYLEIEKEPKLLNQLIVNLEQDDIIILRHEMVLENYDLEKHRDIFNKRRKNPFICFLNPLEVHEGF